MKAWILRQSRLVPLEFVEGGSIEAQTRFPGLAAGELAVIADTGEVWLGNHAWIVCLWALRDSRDLAVRLSSPLLLPMAREAFAVVSANRSAISNRFGIQCDRALEQKLSKVFVPKCQTEPK